MGRPSTRLPGGLDISLVGRVVGRLTVVAEAGRDRHGSRLYRCVCRCGYESLQDHTALKYGRVGQSTRTTCMHPNGDSTLRDGTRRRAPEYSVWENMRRRCNNPEAKDYKWYGARGIQVCERWQVSYRHFIADVGRRPTPQHTLDRIDNNGNYEPGNIRWATKREQRLNQQPRAPYWIKKKGGDGSEYICVFPNPLPADWIMPVTG